jgi:TIR domain
MANNRVDLWGATRRLVAARAGWRCSLPACRAVTTGETGVLAHIAAATPAGPRYDPSLSEAQRQAPENMIWLCHNCAAIIDRRPTEYSAEALHRAKFFTERNVNEGIGGKAMNNGDAEDSPSSRPLRVFLCHASCDNERARSLHRELTIHGYAPWLDESNLLPGQDWNHEISRAIRTADVVIVVLSRASVTKSGYVQKEIRLALDMADEQPEGAIFIIPAKFEDCIVPERLAKWQWVDLRNIRGITLLLRTLAIRASAVR